MWLAHYSKRTCTMASVEGATYLARQSNWKVIGSVYYQQLPKHLSMYTFGCTLRRKVSLNRPDVVSLGKSKPTDCHPKVSRTKRQILTSSKAALQSRLHALWKACFHRQSVSKPSAGRSFEENEGTLAGQAKEQRSRAGLRASTVARERHGNPSRCSK